MADRTVLPAEDVDRGVVALARLLEGIVVVEAVLRRRVERQEAPAAFALERASRSTGERATTAKRGALLQMRRQAVPGVEQGRAHRTGPLALRAEHVVVDHERVVLAEHLGKTDCAAILGSEGIVLRDLAAGRERAPLFRDALGVAAQLDLFGEQGHACLAVVGAVVREGPFGLGGELRRRLQGLFCHRDLLW